MPDRDEDRLAAAEAVRQALAIENELSRSQAKAYVRCLQTTWQVPAIQWGAQETARQLADARRLLHAAHIFRSVEGPDSARGIDCCRRVGEILEWLSRADDPIRSDVPIELLSAAAYQLGNLPAMAAGLLAQVDMDHDGVKLYAAFLRADFDEVLHRAGRFWKANSEYTDPRRAALDVADEPAGVVKTFSVELVRTLGLIADSVRRGEDARLGVAMAKLHSLDALAARTLSDDATLMINLIRQVADGYVAASIFKPMRALAELRPERTPMLETFARDQFARGRGILWTSQRHGIDRLLRETSFALCTPTGSGKTLVANLAIVKELLLREPANLLGPLALYIVPSRALAGEVEAKLSAELRGHAIVTGLYGGSDWGITDYWLTSEQPVVLIVTVEKADALLRYLGPLVTGRMALLIVDEAHQVVPEGGESTNVSFSEHSNRALRLEALVSRILSERPEVVRIALTAVAGGAAGPVAKWIEGRREAEAVGVGYRSTRQVIGVLEVSPGSSGRILLDLMNGRPLYLRGAEDAVFLPLRYAPMPDLRATWRNSLNRFNCLNVLWTALHLAEEDQRILISVAQEPERTMRWYKEALELPAWNAVIGFEAPDGYLGERFEEARAACRDYCGGDSFELFLLERGIATNHGQMPQRLRRLMVEMIDKRICPITVATATLTEGVNLPFDLIFLTSLKRRSWDPVTETPIVAPFSSAEFRNLAGRAGRPGASRGIEGMTLIAIPTAVATRADGKLREQNRQMRERAGDYDDMRQTLIREERDADAVDGPLALLLGRIWDQASRLLGVQPNAFIDWLERTAPADVSGRAGTGASDDRSRLGDAMDELDGVLLTAIEEATRIAEAAMTRAQAEELLARLWSRSFTSVAAEREAWLEAAFIRRGAGVVEHLYPDPDERRRLYHYGFTPLIGRRFEAIAGRIRELIEAADDYGAADAQARVDVFEEIGSLLQGDRGFGFRVRQTAGDQALLDDWADVLAWWMNEPEVRAPAPEDLRSWQRFVGDNLEFRLGVAISAVIARAWSDGAADAYAIPSLADWKAITGLPWFGFWARELLRIGTHDPFVAFCLAQGLAPTREAAAARRAEFDGWLVDELDAPDAESRIDPQLFLAWQQSLRREARAEPAERVVAARLTGTDGRNGRYSVIPVTSEGETRWLDPAGFELAVTPERERGRANRTRSHFELQVVGGATTVRRIFRPA